MKARLLAIVAAGMWVNLNEFVRNELLLKQSWLDHYKSLQTPFPSEVVNALVWMAWGFLFATVLVRLRQKFSFAETILLGWGMGFVLMWLVIGNLKVLPFGILPIAVPWSLGEVVVAVILAQKIMGVSRFVHRGY